MLENNSSQIPPHVLNNIMQIISARSEEVKTKWLDFFGEIRYYC